VCVCCKRVQDAVQHTAASIHAVEVALSVLQRTVTLAELSQEQSLQHQLQLQHQQLLHRQPLEESAQSSASPTRLTTVSPSQSISSTPRLTSMSCDVMSVRTAGTSSDHDMLASDAADGQSQARAQAQAQAQAQSLSLSHPVIPLPPTAGAGVTSSFRRMLASYSSSATQSTQAVSSSAVDELTAVRALAVLAALVDTDAMAHTPRAPRGSARSTRSRGPRSVRLGYDNSDAVSTTSSRYTSRSLRHSSSRRTHDAPLVEAQPVVRALQQSPEPVSKLGLDAAEDEQRRKRRSKRHGRSKRHHRSRSRSRGNDVFV
jgi:hypothetical protein